MSIEKFNTLSQLLIKYPKIELGKAQDLTKITIKNNLIPICRVDNGTRPFWACQCKICKKFKISTSPQIKKSQVPGCCGNIKNLIGQRFGKLQIISLSDNRRDRHVYWKCKCDCGNQCEVCSKQLISGDTLSCGCLFRQQTSHGEFKIAEILKNNNISFITQKQVYINNYKYFDFEVQYQNKKYFIEYDGKQHFKEDCHFGKYESLQIRQKRDQEKNNYCKQHNIPLIRIPYTHYNDLCLEDLLLETSQFII